MGVCERPVGDKGPYLTVGGGEFAFESEFFAAKGDFLFLDGSVAFANGGALGFVDEGPEFGEE